MQRKRSKSTQRAPSARIGSAMAVTDGSETVGYVIEHGGKHQAFDIDGVLIGEFTSLREAMCAIPTIRKSTAAA